MVKQSGLNLNKSNKKSERLFENVNTPRFCLIFHVLFKKPDKSTREFVATFKLFERGLQCTNEFSTFLLFIKDCE